MNKKPDKKPIERKELECLYDIRDAIAEIENHPRFPEGEKAWYRDKYYRGYVERQLGIVGEAATRLCREHEYEIQYSDVEWALIKGLRTVLIHVYWKTDPKILWSIIDEHLPELKNRVSKWINGRERITKVDKKAEPKRESKLLRKLRERVENEHKKHGQ